MRRVINRLGRLLAPAATMVLAASLGLSQVPFEGCYKDAVGAGVPAAHNLLGPADSDGDHHHGSPAGGLILGHCTNLSCNAAVAVLRTVPAPFDSRDLAGFAIARSQSDMRSIVPERDPPVPRIFG